MKIINFGSVNNDFVYSVDHLVRPGETVGCGRFEEFIGGKGLNQSVAAARAGARVAHVGKIGAGDEKLRAALRENGVDVRFLEESRFKSGHAVIQVDRSGQNCIIVYGGANHDVDDGLIDRALSGAEPGDLVLLQNEINNDAYIMEQAHRRGLRIAFNPSPATPAIRELPLAYVSWFILNETEGRMLTEETDPERIVRTLCRRYPGSASVLTLGVQGVLYYDGAAAARHGIYDVPCVDTTGAGDTFVGYFLAGIAKNLEVPECLRIASVASSIAVSRKGASASIPTIGEVASANLRAV